MEKPKLHVSLLLDHTGSMQSNWTQTTEAVETYISGLLKNENLLVKIDLSLFSRMPGVAVVRPERTMRTGDYFEKLRLPEPIGNTPLWEAVSIVSERLLEDHAAGDRVELCVVTDGGENSSDESFPHSRALDAINAMTKREWSVRYLAASVAAHQAGKRLNIQDGMIAQYHVGNVKAAMGATLRASGAYGVSGQSVSASFTPDELNEMLKK